jgi:hypothetical protein
MVCGIRSYRKRMRQENYGLDTLATEIQTPFRIGFVERRLPISVSLAICKGFVKEGHYEQINECKRV